MPTVVGGVGYDGSEDGDLYAIDAATGAEGWHCLTKGMTSTPALTQAVVYVNRGDRFMCDRYLDQAGALELRHAGRSTSQ